MFFLLPGPQYEGGVKEWSAVTGLAAWTIILAYATYKNDEYVKRATWIYAVDIILLFLPFLLLTHTVGTSADSHPSYGDVVIVGSFQLQTYGAPIIAGALTGAPGGITSGAMSAAVYLICLLRIDDHPGNIFDRSHVQGTLARIAFYLVAGFNFGLYNSLVGRLRVAVRAETARQVHQGGLNRLNLIADSLTRAVANAPRDKFRVRVERATACLRLTSESLRRAFLTRSGPTQIPIAAIVSGTTSVLLLLDDDDHEIHLDTANIDDSYSISADEAAALEGIVSEAIVNSVKYSAPGTIHVLAHALDGGGCAIRVTDPGPAEDATVGAFAESGSGHGRAQIERLAHEHGWELTHQIGQAFGVASIVAVLLDRDQLATSAE